MNLEKVELIKSLIKEESYLEAISLLDKEVDDPPVSTEAYYYLSVCYFKSGVRNKAYNYVGKSIEIDSKNMKSLILLSELYKNDDEIITAKQYIEKALNIEPDNHEARIQIAKIVFYEQRVNEAEEYLNKLLQENPDDTQAKCLLVKVYIQKKEPLPNILGLIKELKSTNKGEDLDFDKFYANYIHEEYDECKKIYRLMYRKNPYSKLTLKANELLKKPKKIKVKSNEYISVKDELELNETVDEEPSITLDSALKKLDDFIGLESVKTEVKKIVKLVQYNKVRDEKLELNNIEKPSYHFLFTGNPGTGKTTIARILGDIFYATGILEKPDVIEVDRAGLVGEHIGETAVKTQKVIESALGGVLFIDEAYALAKDAGSTNDFGAEAVDTLLKAMEDHRDNLIVIFAGYKEEMKNLIKMNPGLESRINKKILFEDYGDEELLTIAKSFARKNHYYLTQEAETAFLQKIGEEQVKVNFSNARAVRNLIEDAIQTRAYRLSEIDVKNEDLQILEPKDFGIDLSQLFSDDFEELMTELKSLEGLNAVKHQVESIINIVRANERRKKIGVDNTDMSLHMMFLGNPGTGKTMVARLISKLLKSIGVLKRGHVVEVGREDLVAQYVGQTAPKTLEKIREAYGGVLFIDEAYTLASSSEQDFGKEAVGTLIREMEDNRDKIIVIMAGYTSEMNDLLSLNSGLKSRIAYEINFPDYTSEELANIFDSFIFESQFKLVEGTLDKIERKFHQLSIQSTQDFGNARLARQLFEKILMIQSNRIAEDNNADPLLITSEDINKL